MKSEDDPEARIRELEQPLADAARASEASANPSPGKWAPPPGPPMPPPVVPYGGAYQSPPIGTRRQGRGLWILLALFVIGMIALPIAIFLFSAHQVTHGGLTTLLPAPSMSSRSPTPSGMVPSTTAVAPPASVTTAPAGENTTVSGINEVRTIACNGGTVNVSGITNNVTITGHCTSVNVSGIQNQVTVDTSDNIQASGSGNHVTYHSGSPKVGNSGFDNVVQQG
jgi:cytoskeletal protein RodZ